MQNLIWCEGDWREKISWQNDLGLQRADGVIEVLAARGAVLFHWYDHWSRLMAGCDGYIPREKLPSGQEIKAKAECLLKKDGNDRSVVRILVTPGDSDDMKTPSGSPKLSLDVRPLTESESKPLRLMTVVERRKVPNLKLACDYGTVNRNIQRIQGMGYDSFLYYDHIDGILEGPYENVFFITTDDWLITPYTHNRALAGVTRKIVLDLAQRSELFKRVSEYEIGIDLLKLCREAFFTSTTRGITPIKQIIYRAFEVGPDTLTSKLQKLLWKYSDNYFRERGA